jgi:hypothetical protein
MLMPAIEKTKKEEKTIKGCNFTGNVGVSGCRATTFLVA